MQNSEVLFFHSEKLKNQHNKNNNNSTEFWTLFLPE
jgi:hypothetical protein